MRPCYMFSVGLNKGACPGLLFAFSFLCMHVVPVCPARHGIVMICPALCSSTSADVWAQVGAGARREERVSQDVGLFGGLLR